MSDSGLWRRVAAFSELADDAALPVRLGDVPIALYRLNGQVHAIDDVCTHEFALLSPRFRRARRNRMPAAPGALRYRDRALPGAARDVDLRRYAVRIDGDDVYVCARPLSD